MIVAAIWSSNNAHSFSGVALMRASGLTYLRSICETLGEQPAATEISVLWAHGLKRLRGEGATVEAANLQRRRDGA